MEVQITVFTGKGNGIIGLMDFAAFALSQKLSFPETPEFAAACAVIGKLQSCGFTAWLAGGCVRDGLLGRSPRDFDVATSAHPEEVEAAFARTVAVGKSFGVIRVLIDDLDVEVATFRKDGLYVDGRRPDDVEYSDARQDSARRDFTINALFYDPARELIYDFHDGIADLRARTIRAIGEAEHRFREDHLRVLRGLRFAAELGFEIEPRTFAALRALVPLVKSVSLERRKDEMEKFFTAEYRARWIEEFTRSGLAVVCCRGLSPEPGRWRAWGEGGAAAAVTELALWLLDSGLLPEGRAAEELLKELKFSGGNVRYALNVLWLFHFPEVLGEELAEAVLLEKSFEPGVREGLALWASRNASPVLVRYEELRKNLRALPPPIVRADDLPKLKGKTLGEALKRARKMQLSGYYPDKASILAACAPVGA